MRFNGWPLASIVCATLVSGPAAPGVEAAQPATISPGELATVLKGPAVERPLVIQVGFKIMFQQAHIPGAEYVGPGADAAAIEQLRKRVSSLHHDAFIVLYCGCCPWGKCPNVQPAAALLRSMGFTNVKLLHLANNFGADWAEKGYPVVAGQ